MADFYQHGMITTLQRLGKRPLAELETDLQAVARMRNIALLLPALVSEFDTPSMPRIIDELKGVRYLRRLVLSLDRANRRQFSKVKKALSVLPMEVRVVWHDGPRMKALYKELRTCDFSIDTPGKGRSVWMTLGYLLADKNLYAIALHDTDIVNYSREMLARLIYPVVHPAVDFEFSKGYYARVTDRLYGRVTRLYYIPLIRTLKRILEYNAFLEYLGNFRYALSGEFALVSSLARGIRISPTWGLEVSLLSEVYQRASLNRICQVEISETYEHKHQEMDRGKPDAGLVRMAKDIAEALIRVLSQDGIVMSQAFFRTLYTAYIEEARVTIEKYHALSLLNGLYYDRHSEIEATEIFVVALREATKAFVADPVGIPMMSAWVRVEAAIPDFGDRLTEAVEADNR
ncbi:MAG: glycosyl transferase [Syntrophales bacterium]|mgnify:CR=1 FL=1|jgi:glucosyl-3-phosphoglycerate synthase|nr:glycosyl transferase [Syntrophales bacterium]HOG07983.1 glycosyl transferase [Syntrophales bacterium]HOS76534.1 glycosyl transferase [Syntrophales bacterium]HPB69460.1 glycosyl transferase [Syntrophales bacterium]HQN25209.1 glycosyl transferase [Syntrophales bacterium]